MMIKQLGKFIRRLKRRRALDKIRKGMELLGVAGVSDLSDEQIERAILLTAKAFKDMGWTAEHFAQRLYIQTKDLAEMCKW